MNNEGYKHLSLEDRITIQTLLDQCATPYAISKMLKRSLSTIQREIKRYSKVTGHTGNDCLIKKQCKKKDACNHHHLYVMAVTDITHALTRNVNTMARKPMICIWQGYVINALDLILQKMD